MFWVLRQIREYQCYDKYSAETVDRLIQSKHVKDLRWVARITVWLALVSIAFIVLVMVWLSNSSLFSKPVEILLPLLISVVAVVGAVFAWCYKIGSGRLGIIDLFSCEITTLCRICTIVGIADSCVEAYNMDASRLEQIKESFRHFDSSEAYTPVFDGNAKELQSLSVKVVINMTAFYTYWKATRDAFRKLAKTEKKEAWHAAILHVIYMHFLALESARKAVRDLIEFEPNNAENTITILLSELPAYGFLLRQFEEDARKKSVPQKEDASQKQDVSQKEDVRRARLKLRRARYREIVPKLYYHTKHEHEKYQDLGAARKRFSLRDDLEELCRDWEKAYRMLDDLKIQYEAAIGESILGYAPPPRQAPSSALNPGTVTEIGAHRPA
jgi:hypothetical protein